ncbi:MAG: N-succinylarginine dihydrolase [Hyphomonadaceae bacterium]
MACAIRVRVAGFSQAIDAGAFHNDVVAVAHEHVLFHHQQAFADSDALRAEVRRRASGKFEPVFVEISQLASN